MSWQSALSGETSLGVGGAGLLAGTAWCLLKEPWPSRSANDLTLRSLWQVSLGTSAVSTQG